MALLDEVAARLISQAVGVQGTTASWSVFKGYEPPTPAQAITLFETGGFPNQPHEGQMLDVPTFQVRVRGANTSTGYPAARTKIAAARTALEAMTGTFSGRYYCQVVAQNEPISLGQDATNRPILVQNFTAHRSRT